MREQGPLRLRVRLHGGRPSCLPSAAQAGAPSPPGITPSRCITIPWRWSERPSMISSPLASAPASGSPGSCAVSPGMTPRASWWKRTSGTFSAAATAPEHIPTPSWESFHRRRLRRPGVLLLRPAGRLPVRAGIPMSASMRGRDGTRGGQESTFALTGSEPRSGVCV